jgi:hypothetical protein
MIPSAKLLVPAAALLCLLAGGCATVMRGDTQTVRFDTDPAGATVTAGALSCTTPGELPLKRKETYTILVSKEGYRPVTFDMSAQWDGAALPGVVLPGGSVMIATDRASGADLAFYTPPQIKLEPAPPGAEPKQMVLYRARLLTRQEHEQVLEAERLELLRHRE